MDSARTMTTGELSHATLILLCSHQLQQPAPVCVKHYHIVIRESVCQFEEEICESGTDKPSQAQHTPRREVALIASIMFRSSY